MNEEPVSDVTNIYYVISNMGDFNGDIQTVYLISDPEITLTSTWGMDKPIQYSNAAAATNALLNTTINMPDDFTVDNTKAVVMKVTERTVKYMDYENV